MSSSLATVSVVIPLYNKAEYIARALDSVFAQTYQDYEVIVVNDGSTDNGPGIVKQYTDPRLRLVHQANAGPGAARNGGIKESNAPYIAFLDADDEWLPQFLEKSLSKLGTNPDCDIVASTYFLGSEKTDVTPIFKKRGLTEGPWRLSNNINKRELKHAIYILHSSSTVCRREVIEKYGGFYAKNSCNYGEDYYLWLQILLNHKMYRIMEPLFWLHSEASELGMGAKSLHPLEPVLTNPQLIRERCPREYRTILELWLAQYALLTAHELALSGDLAKALYLKSAFPLMKSFGWEYVKLRFKLVAPSLIPFFRCVKKTLRINKTS